MSGAKLRVAVVGANGRMGVELASLLKTEVGMVPAMAVVRKGSAPGFGATTQKITDLKRSTIDVVIDFSNIELFDAVLEQCLQENLPLVTGVTGLSAKDFAALDTAAKKIPVLWAANMSIGIALFKKMIAVVAGQPGFEFQISETHHNQKKDAPSGTALDLQKTLEHSSGRPWPAPLAMRGGGVIGDHSLYAFAEEEVLEISHRAIKRSVFARGALKAAAFLAKQTPGRYEIEDLISEADRTGFSTRSFPK